MHSQSDPTQAAARHTGRQGRARTRTSQAPRRRLSPASKVSSDNRSDAAAGTTKLLGSNDQLWMIRNRVPLTAVAPVTVWDSV